MDVLITWLTVTLSVLVASYLLPGVTVLGFIAALLVALVLGIINAFVKPVILLLTLPLNVLTLGLLTFVINALLIILIAFLVPGFRVDNFWWALLFSIILTLILNFLNLVFSQHGK